MKCPGGYFACPGRASSKMTKKKTAKVVTLGGVSEIGKNMTAIEYGGRILVIDSGLMFPDADMLGVDIVIPDITYLAERAECVDGIVLTHGHEDHIGALPYVLRQINVPIWGTRLTLGFVKAKLEEFGLADEVEMHEVQASDTFKVGSFDVESVRVSHSIPDGFGLAIKLPVGTIFHSGDFKFDHTPIDGFTPDFARLAELGSDGVRLLLIDSTNVEKPGHVPSERVVGEVLQELFSKAEKKIIVAAFASNIHRVQQVFNTAELFGRKVAVAGKSMARNIEIALELGYLTVKEGIRITLDDVQDLHPAEVVVMTTGSQGEPLSALTRIATDEHNKISIEKGDTVIISATPIPGNEDLVMQTINSLFKRGASVYYDAIAPVHVSGHGNREELKLMLNLTKPEFIIPVHGEQRHISRFVELAEDVGIGEDRVFRMEPGDVVELRRDGAEKVGKVPAGEILVDGIGVGDVGGIVLRERRRLAHDGVFVIIATIDRGSRKIIAGPDIASKGFIYMDEAEELIGEVKELIRKSVDEASEEGDCETDTLRERLRVSALRLLNAKTGRRPTMIVDIVEI